MELWLWVESNWGWEFIGAFLLVGGAYVGGGAAYVHKIRGAKVTALWGPRRRSSGRIVFQQTIFGGQPIVFKQTIFGGQPIVFQQTFLRTAPSTQRLPAWLLRGWAAL